MREMTAGTPGGGPSPIPYPGPNSGFTGLSGKIPFDLVGTVKHELSDLFGQNANDAKTTNIYYSGKSLKPDPIVYYDAPFAEKYGMSAETAYQEALSNTAHQREVADLKAAGLNPVLGFNGSGANGVYSASLNRSYGSYGSYGSGKSTSSAADTVGKLSYWLPTFANGAVNTLVTLTTGNGMTGFGAGMIAQNLVSGALGAIRNHGDSIGKFFD